MTAVMRAAAVTREAPRVPRVAMVAGGRIVDERLFRNADAITVGTAEDATFTLAGPLPERFVLVERVGTKHYLRFVAGMTGRIALGSDRFDLASLHERAHESRGARRIELTDDARGKVVFGGVTFLFQLVPAPPLPTTPRLPLGVLDGVGGSVDWRLAIIAAMSFLVHFAIVGGAYSDWMDPVVDTDRSVAALIDMKRNLPDVPVEDPSTRATTPSDTPMTTPKKEDGAVANTGPKGPPGPTKHQKSGPMSDTTAADLAARASAIEVGMIASLTGGPATKRALDRNSEIPPVDLRAAARSAEGAAHDHDPLGARHASGPVKPGTKNGLSSIASTQGDANQGPGTQGNTPAGPSLSVDVRPPTFNGAPVSDADRVVAGLRSRFRKCYQDGLNDDPTMSGKTTLAAKVQPNGEVASVDVVENQGLSPRVTSCMAKALKNAQFTANGSFSTVRVPVTMIQQAR